MKRVSVDGVGDTSEANQVNRANEAAAVGVDAGATLAKLAIQHADGREERRLVPAADPAALDAALAELAPAHLGLTGAGSADLAGRLAERGGLPTPVRVMEFAAWGSGAAYLLKEQGLAGDDPYLLVSLGTGTSVMLADGLAVHRVGGTALGGGTVIGLGGLLVGERDFGALARLAAGGDRRHVDLLVSDIYRPGEIALTGDLTAANFGKLARPEASDASPEDLAQAIMGLVGENVALICAGLGSAQGRPVRRVVFGGSTLRDNPSLRDVLQLITSAFGHEVVFLEGGEFAGAVGALRLGR